MKIGIASPIDVRVFLPYIENQTDRDIINMFHGINAPSVATLALSLLSAGNKVKIFTLTEKSYVIKSDNVDIIAVKSFNVHVIKQFIGIWEDAARLKNAIECNLDGLDVLHAHWTYSYAYACKNFTSKLPVFCTIRDWAPYIFKFVNLKSKIQWASKMIMANKVYRINGMHFIANSPYTASTVQKNVKLEVETIPNSVLDSFFEKVERRDVPNLKIICISSSHDDRKNMVSLFKAFSIVMKSYPDATLDIIGKPFYPDNPSLKKFYDENLINENVNLIGVVKHHILKDYLDKASVFVSPSLEETFGNTFLESIARKLPTIGGKYSGAVPFVLHHGEAGYLCDVSSPEEIAKMIIYVHTHKDEAREKAERAIEIIKSEYSESIVCKKHIELYRSFITKS